MKKQILGEVYEILDDGSVYRWRTHVPRPGEKVGRARLCGGLVLERMERISESRARAVREYREPELERPAHRSFLSMRAS